MMHASASFGLVPQDDGDGGGPASPGALRAALHRRGSVAASSTLAGPLLTSVERTLSVLRSDFVERMRESVGPELEDVVAAQQLQRRLSRSGTSSAAAAAAAAIVPPLDSGSPILSSRRRKNRRWRKMRSASTMALHNRRARYGATEDGAPILMEDDADDDDHDDDADDDQVGYDAGDGGLAYSHRHRDGEKDSDEEGGLPRLADAQTQRRTIARSAAALQRAKQAPRRSVSLGREGGGGGLGGASSTASGTDSEREAVHIRVVSTGESEGATDSDGSVAAIEAARNLAQSLSSSSSTVKVPRQKYLETPSVEEPYRSPLVEKHHEMIKQWQSQLPYREDQGDEDLEAGLPLLPRGKGAQGWDPRGQGKLSSIYGYTYGGVEIQEDYDEAVLFLKDLCEALHLFGASAHRIEYNMNRASNGLGIVAAYAVFPELCIMSFGPQDDRKAETYLYRKHQGGLNCAKLRWCDDLASKVSNKQIGLREAAMELYIIRQLGPVYPLWVKLIMYGLASFAVCAVFFKGGWLEMILSFILGTGVGVVSLVGTRYESVARMLEAIVSIAAAFLARLFVEYVYPACWGAISLSTIVWMLPGLSLTVGVNELAERKMIAGTVRIFFAMLVALELGFGLAIGSVLVFWEDEAEFLQRAGDHLCDPINEWAMVFFFFIITFTFNGLLEALPNQWPMMTFTSSLSYGISVLGAYVGLRTQICTTLSAFASGVVGHLHSRITGHTATIPITAGILVLVPGSVGVRGVKALMENDIVSGIQFGFNMLTIALSIIVGLFVANMLFPLRKTPSS